MTLTVTGLDGTIVTAQMVINVAAPLPPTIEVVPPPIEEATPPPTEVPSVTTEPPPEQSVEQLPVSP